MFLPILGFFLGIAVLLVLSRLTSRTLFKLLGEGWYIVLLWPGVVVHEGSHLLGAVLTLTPVRGFSLLPERGGSASRVLGVVRHDRPKNALATIIISAFPLIGGALAVWLLTLFLLPGLSTSIAAGDWQTASGSFISSFGLLISRTTEAVPFGSWQTWLFIYLSFTVTAHLAPSNHDLKHVATGLISFTALLVLLYAIGNFVQTSIIHNAFVWLVGYVNASISKVFFVFVYLAFLLMIVTIISVLLLSLKKRIRGY